VILVDTSIWIDHFRRTDPTLASALEREEVLMHPFVLGELACGNLRNRREVLDLLGLLPVAPSATDAEVLEFIERRSLMGRGIGYVDVHLLASVALADTARLWTRDRRLFTVAAELNVSVDEAP
jgi:predicted nucleic acid-binding protein